ncbi:MAG TPA: methyltransferase domain-containing protein, partial [Deinococcales bacterium]|nr:methyltransferase domain-containing protein [Deinococcales bacterium]
GASVDAVWAGGVLPHLADPGAALAEWARVTRPGGRLAVFHAVGRAALGAVHADGPAADGVLAPERLEALLEASGWRPVSRDDGGERFLLLAQRAG